MGRIKLSENDLHKLVKESAKRVINEYFFLPKELWDEYNSEPRDVWNQPDLKGLEDSPMIHDKTKMKHRDSMRSRMPGQKVYDDGECVVWKLSTFEEFASLPFKNNCCLGTDPGLLEYYYKDYDFYVIDNGREAKRSRLVIAGVARNHSNVIFTDVYDNVLNPSAVLSTLPPEVSDIIKGSGVAESRKRKKSVRLSESELHNVIRNAVSKVLSDR